MSNQTREKETKVEMLVNYAKDAAALKAAQKNKHKDTANKGSISINCFLLATFS